jgi:hypothetical protein
MTADAMMEVSGGYGHPARVAAGPGLSGGIQALASIAAISTLATLAMAATTAGHIAWPDAAFQVMATAMIAAVMVAHSRSISSARLMFMLGVLLASLPSLLIAVENQAEHWDDYMTWLPNALYIWKLGGFPTPEAPPVASDLPGYPPGSSIVLAAAWSVAGRAVAGAGPVLNVVGLMVLPGLILRALEIEPGRQPLRNAALGVTLGLAATILNVGLDWHWVLSSLPEVAMVVAFAAAFVLAAECLFRRSSDARARLVALAAILAFITNVKQTGLALAGILVIAAAMVAWIGRHDDRRGGADAALTAGLVLVPAVTVWLAWHLYLSRIFTAFAVSFRPLNDWYFSMLPDLLLAIGSSMGRHWLFFVPIGAVVARGFYLLARGLAGRDRAPMSMADRLVATFALVQVGYLVFLIVCYIGAFGDEEVPRAAEFFRYEAEVGGAGVLSAVVLAVQAWRQRQWPAPIVAIAAMLIGAAVVVRPAAGIFHHAPELSVAEVAHLRELGREAGRLVVRDGRKKVEMITATYALAWLVMRYELWASAPTQITAIRGILSEEEEEGEEIVARLPSYVSEVTVSVSLIDGDSTRCGFYSDGRPAKPLPASEASDDCRLMLPQFHGGEASR